MRGLISVLVALSVWQGVVWAGGVPPVAGGVPPGGVVPGSDPLSPAVAPELPPKRPSSAWSRVSPQAMRLPKTATVALFCGKEPPSREAWTYIG